jgi:hypothetical protein
MMDKENFSDQLDGRPPLQIAQMISGLPQSA